MSELRCEESYGVGASNTILPVLLLGAHTLLVDGWYHFFEILVLVDIPAFHKKTSTKKKPNKVVYWSISPGSGGHIVDNS